MPPDCHQTISSSERKQLIKAEVKSWTSSERPIIVKWHLLSPNRPRVSAKQSALRGSGDYQGLPIHRNSSS